MRTRGERARCADGEEDRGALPDGVEGDRRRPGRGRAEWEGRAQRMMESFVWVGADLTCEAEVQPIHYRWLSQYPLHFCSSSCLRSPKGEV